MEVRSLCEKLLPLSREDNENLNQDICSGIEKQRMDTKFY